jgi:RNA polymerase sigma factor (sigma-70 family)
MPNTLIVDDLLAAAKSGDAHAENQLFFLLGARILPLVQQRIRDSKRPPDEIRREAEDIAQDVCLLVRQNYKTIPLDRFWPWVFQIVRNKIGDYYRRQRTRGKVSRLEPDDPSSKLQDPISPIELMEGEDLIRLISHALSRMTKRCRAIIKAFLEDQTIEARPDEIHRCRERLKKLLREQGYDI